MPGRQRNQRFRRSHHLAIGIKYVRFHSDLRRLRTVILQQNTRADIGLCHADRLGRHINARPAMIHQIDMDATCGDQRDITVEPAEDVEITRQRRHLRHARIIDPHGNQVVTGFQGVGNIEAKGRIAAFMMAHAFSIDPHIRYQGRAVELQDIALAGHRRDLQLAAIPARSAVIDAFLFAARGVAALVCVAGIEGMRQGDRLPAIGIIIHCFGFRHVAFHKQPVVVERPLFAGHGRQGEKNGKRQQQAGNMFHDGVSCLWPHPILTPVS